MKIKHAKRWLEKRKTLTRNRKLRRLAGVRSAEISRDVEAQKFVAEVSAHDAL